MTRALFVGLSTLDIVQLVDHVPAPNQKVVASDFLVAAGGPAANAAVAFAHLGGRPTLVTALPDHPLSAVLADDLTACGVEVQVASSYPGPPITASILVTQATGERAVVSPSNAATSAPALPPAVRQGRFRRETGPDALLEGLGVAGLGVGLGGVGVVLLDGYFRELAGPVVEQARRAGIPVLLDAGSAKPYTDEVVAMADVVVASEDFAPCGTDGSPDEVFAYLADAGVRFAGITRGGRSILYRTPSGGGEVEVDAVPVADTLGAGDFFHGALAWQIATKGLDDARFAEDLRAAAQVAGSSLGTFGTRAWLTTAPGHKAPGQPTPGEQAPNATTPDQDAASS